MLPSELLRTLAELAVAFAGLSALALVVVQLAGVQWQAQLTTGLWLMVAWSLGALVFSIGPLLLNEFGISDDAIISVMSFGLASFILAVIVSALRRDMRLLRLGGPARPPVGTMISMGVICTVSSISLFLNAFALLPGGRPAWYAAGVFALLLFGTVPLVHLLLEVHQKD